MISPAPHHGIAEALRPVLDTTLDAVVAVGGDGCVLAWNDTAEETFGWARSEALGRSLGELIVPPQHRAAHLNGMIRFQKTGKATVLNRRIEITALHRSGREFPVELSITTSTSPDGILFIGFLRDISVRREADEALRASEAYIRLLLASTAEGFYAVDSEGVTTLCNPGFVKMLGFESEEAVLGRKLHRVIHHSHADGTRYAVDDCPIYRCARFGTPAHVAEEIFFRLDGTALPVEYSVYPVMRAGELQGAICTFRDLSEAKRAAAALEHAQERSAAAAREQAAILDQLAEGVIVADIEGRLTLVNEAAARLHGVSALGVAPDRYSEAYHLFTEWGEPFPAADLPLSRAVRGETVSDAKWQVRRPDGTSVLVIGHAQPLRDGDGRQVGAVLTLRDDTKRANAEREVRENEARLRALTDHLPGGMVYQLSTGVNGTDRRFTFVSQSHERLTGVPPEAVLRDAQAAYQLIHPDDRAALAEAEQQAIRDGSPFDVQVRFRRADGEERWCRILSAPRAQADGTTIWDGLQIDITDLVEAKRALQELNRTLERRVEERTRERDRAWKNSRDLQAVLGVDGTLKAANQAWPAILGWGDAELVGQPLSAFIHPEDQAASLRALESARTEELPVFENRLRHRDGSFRWFSWVAAPEDGLIYASGRHITAEKEAGALLEATQEQLRQAQKMEAIGHLTGGIAHDFNNLLTVVIGNADIARRAIAAGDGMRAERSIASALKGAERAAVLTQRLLAFSRRQPLAPKPTDIGRLISGMSDMLARALGETVRLEVVSSAGLWRAEIDPPQLESAILNLAVNARDAMPGGGKLTIEASNTRIGATYAAAHAEVAPGQYVVVAVTDTGQGMPPHVVAQAFDPFFTTKEVGKGTGLGLSQVYGFVKQSGGHVKIYSEPGEGTTIKLYFPRMAGELEEEDAQPVQTVEEGTPFETVLVVEDDDDVRAYTVESLRELRYRVLEAHDGPSALRLLERQSEPIQLLFTDVVMPEMSGRALADQARTLQPELKVLFTTGYARNAIVHGGRLDAGVDLLPKPFTFEALAAKVREVLDLLPARLLVVDPDHAQRLATRELLTRAGLAVDEAMTAREALGRLGAIGGRFEIVIVDTALGHIEQFVASARAVRHDLPILLIAEADAAALAARYAGDRCIGVIARPFSEAELQAELGALHVSCAE